jgi:ABC-type uncharacterized transport system ATPase subunit
MALVEVRSVSKSFGATRALSEVSLDFEAGEVVALLGENGAGKSTLMNVLTGSVVPDRGSVALDGKPLPLGNPARCREAGVQCVHQHFTLVPALSVAENLALATAAPPWSLERAGRAVGASAAVAARLGWEFDPGALVRDLSVGAMQRIEVVKALAGGGRLLLLDEPTAVLSPDEAAELLALVRRLRDDGMCVVIVTHRLAETFAVADRAAVLRAGRLVGVWDVARTDAGELAEAMVGGAVPEARSRPASPGAVVAALEAAEVRSDRGHMAVRGASLELRAGEVVGVGGVDGNGQIELAEAFAGIRPLAAGSRRLAAERVAYIPPDRQTGGLVLTLSVAENLLLGQDLRRWSRHGLLRVCDIRAWAQGLVERFDVRPPDAGAQAGSLSGGNQQKVVVARNLHERPDVLVAVNPTRGLDIRAESYVRRALADAAEAGAAVLLVTSDLDELEALSHRTVFMDSGRLVERMLGAAG